MVVSVESSDKHDVNTLSTGCTEEEFRTIEASLYQVLHNISKRTTGINATNARTGAIRSHVIVRRYDQRNMSGNIPHTQH